MFEQLYEQLESLLSQHGIITNVLLKSERSLYDEAELLQMELYFAEDDQEHLPLATIHLFPLDQGACEVEVEITFDQINGRARDAALLWEQARSIVAELSLSEKKRFLAADRLAEHLLILDYHFVVSLPQTEEEEAAHLQKLSRFAADLGKLVRL